MSSTNPVLDLDRAALIANWRWFAAAGGTAACGAAIKADGYGLGARGVFETLGGAGCRDFFVAHWREVAPLGPIPDDVGVAVLHGVTADDMQTALASRARPVLCTMAQVAAWVAAGGGVADVMVDTGMNRLGLSPAEAVTLPDALKIDTLHSHLACAETRDHPLNARQRDMFAALVDTVRPPRASLASSAGITLGTDYAFGLTRPGLGLYGGQPVNGQTLPLAQVARIFATVVQCRDVRAGESIGYGATFVASRPTRVAVLALGYADGYPRALAGAGFARVGDTRLPVVGRISMDLMCVDAGNTPIAEGDRIEVDFDLGRAGTATGLAQYELLTRLGDRYTRRWS
jgi:alanine racemase